MLEALTTSTGNATSGCRTSSLERGDGEEASREEPAVRRGEGVRPGEQGEASREGHPLGRGSTRVPWEVILKKEE